MSALFLMKDETGMNVVLETQTNLCFRPALRRSSA